jgi:O-antigen ligase
MQAVAAHITPGILYSKKSATHRLALGLVWLAFAVSAVVFTEPAPVDVLMLGLIILLPVIGLVRITQPLLIVLAIWLIAAACALLATFNAIDPVKALIHTAVTVFLALTGFTISAFIMRRPEGHTTLLLHGYTAAALIAATAGLIGYFGVLPGSYELFTKYARASGTFKDPNVFGPFLIAPLLYVFHRMLNSGILKAVMLGGAALVLTLAILLSFSRGAWVNLAIASLIFGYFAFVTAPTNWQRVKLIGVALAGLIGLTTVLVIALQFDEIGNLFAQRATLTQSYDEGPEGRFGGQEKARRLILENPFGLGAQQFAPTFHSEEAHNVYLSMFLNAGWLGGLIFAVMVLLTCIYGFRHSFRRTATQPLFLIAYACFVGHAAEGLLIDLDHWRHFQVLLAVVWGLMLGDRAIVARAALYDPRAIFAAAEMLVPSRHARIMRPAASAIVQATPAPRRKRAEPPAPRRSFGRRA